MKWMNYCKVLLYNTLRVLRLLLLKMVLPCKGVVDRYADRLNIKYFSKPNSGPGQTRNYGAERSEGEYLIILDSDVILPEGYFDAVEKELTTSPADAFGGPDRAHDSFTDIQKATIP